MMEFDEEFYMEEVLYLRQNLMSQQEVQKTLYWFYSLLYVAVEENKYWQVLYPCK